MKIFCYWAAFIAALYVAQSSLLSLPTLSYNGVSADLLLLATASFAFLRGERLGVLMGFLVGLTQDLATGTFFGVNTFAKMVIGYVCGAFSRNVFKEHYFLPLSISVSASAAEYSILLVFMILLGYRVDFVSHIHTVFIPMLVYNAAFAIPTHHLMRRMCAFVKEQSRKR